MRRYRLTRQSAADHQAKARGQTPGVLRMPRTGAPLKQKKKCFHLGHAALETPEHGKRISFRKDRSRWRACPEVFHKDSFACFVAGVHRGRTYRRPHSLPPVLKTGRYTGNDTLPLLPKKLSRPRFLRRLLTGACAFFRTGALCTCTQEKRQVSLALSGGPLYSA